MERSDLKEATLASVRWVAGARVGLQIVGFGSNIALARLIGPAEFGRVAVALIVVALAVVLAPQAFGSALVRFQGLDRRHLESATFLSLLTGIALTCATFLLAPVVVEPLFDHRVALFVRIVSPTWLLASVSAVPLALLQRRMDFRRISIGEIGATLAGTGTTLGLAAAGANGEALVIGALATAFVSTVYYVCAAPLVRPRWHRGASREVTAYGVPVALSSLAYIGFLNVDYAMLAARLGPAQTGLYWRGYQLAFEYQGKLSGILQRIAFPLYSRTDDLEDMKRMRARISRLHATVLFAPVLTLVPVAPALVPLLFGEGWDDAVRPTQLLVPVGLAGALAIGIGPMLVAAGRSVALLVTNVTNMVLYGTMVYLVAPHGLTTVCAAVSGYAVVSLVAVYAVMGRLVGISVRGFLSDAVPGLVAGCALLAVAFPVTRMLTDAGASRALIVVGASGVGALAYGLVLRLVFPSTWKDVSLLLRRAVPPLRLRRRTSELPQVP